MNSYRLLRDNKETGPYSTGQLIAKGLKAYDLVWVEGRSAAWRYPCEIADLAPFAPPVEEQPYDRFFKKSTDKKEEKKPKPRYRVTADSRKIDEVKKPIPATPSPVAQTVSASLATFNHYTHISEPEPVLETKYQGSLDDIKRRYEEKILNADRSRPFLLRYAWLLIIPLIGAGIWLGYEISAPEKAEKITQQQTLPKLKVIENATEPNNEKEIADPETAANDQPEEQEETDVKNIATNTLIRPVEQKLPSPAIVNKPTDKPVQQVVSNTKPEKQVRSTPIPAEIILPEPKAVITVQQETSNTGRQPRVNTERVAVNENKPINRPVVTTTETRPPVAGKTRRIDDYVVIEGDYKKDGNTIQDLAIKVENITPYAIDLVVLDIQYFDKNGRLQKGETVYARNVPARRDVVVNAPSANAHKVGYKVSLVSAEKAGVYLVAD